MACARACCCCGRVWRCVRADLESLVEQELEGVLVVGQAVVGSGQRVEGVVLLGVLHPVLRPVPPHPASTSLHRRRLAASIHIVTASVRLRRDIAAVASNVASVNTIIAIVVVVVTVVIVAAFGDLLGKVDRWVPIVVVIGVDLV